MLTGLQQRQVEGQSQQNVDRKYALYSLVTVVSAIQNIWHCNSCHTKGTLLDALTSTVCISDLWLLQLLLVCLLEVSSCCMGVHMSNMYSIWAYATTKLLFGQRRISI